MNRIAFVRLIRYHSSYSSFSFLREETFDLDDPAALFLEPMHLSAHCGDGAVRPHHEGGSRNDPMADGARRRETNQGIQLLPVIVLGVSIAENRREAEAVEERGACVV